MNNEEIKTLLEANLELNKENNRMLHKIRGIHKRAHFFMLFRWLLIIGFAFGAYYYVQPYFNRVIEIYNSIPNFGNIDVTKLEGIINGLKP
ncbi:MAG: hypothetical protein US50_C0022G0006 [Candidatus Nomurabacteria bacterium GW2011_GWB1_37_5]|uniref:Uncharacterized protein n=1 Tax=Candidatus Nomurabacteria bacterium GW2011_GWB1_37_5 TaxID=1618742 RepID=A0A0G0GW24_9BACT|nr:MAG: hypothetical protein US50_C0022G0006 [Candidatus Nomurabacteria bacterium GW2011_GWB1_37_5]